MTRKNPPELSEFALKLVHVYYSLRIKVNELSNEAVEDFSQTELLHYV